MKNVLYLLTYLLFTHILFRNSAGYISSCYSQLTEGYSMNMVMTGVTGLGLLLQEIYNTA